MGLLVHMDYNEPTDICENYTAFVLVERISFDFLSIFVYLALNLHISKL